MPFARERHHVRRHAGVHGGGGRGAGSDRRTRARASAIKAANIPVQAIFNNDIVGGSTGGDGIVDGATIRLYRRDRRTRRPGRLRYSRSARPARYVPSHRVRLMARRDRFGRGGDHTAWNLEGFAAVGFRESRENYARQHNANDTLDGVSFAYLGQNARVNAAAMAVLALAPPPPVVADEQGRATARSGSRIRLRRASPVDRAAPGAAGYRSLLARGVGARLAT